MATITLDSIRESIEKKYAPVVIDLGGGKSCTLVAAMRLSKEDRRKLVGLQDAANKADGDNMTPEQVDGLVDLLKDMIGIVASKPAEAKALLAACGDDLAMLQAVIEEYMGGTEPGEASPSPA